MSNSPSFLDNQSAETVLSGVFNGTASKKNPCAIVQPKTIQEAVEIVKWTYENKKSFTIRSGGHSTHCTKDGTVMIDLSQLNSISINPPNVTIQAGVTMGQLILSLAPHNLTIPVGTHSTPGFGLLTQGGIGHLSRTFGLTMDHVTSLTICKADGSLLTLTPNDQDFHKILGAAPFSCLVLEATLKARSRTPLAHFRAVYPVTCTQALLDKVKDLLPGNSCSFIVGTPPDNSNPCLFILCVTPTNDVPAMAIQNDLVNFLGLGKPLYYFSGIASGLETLPQFDIPDKLDSKTPPSPPTPRQQRLDGIVFSPLLPQNLPGLGQILIDFINITPNSMSRFEFQHVGGKVNQPPNGPCLYLDRQAEWSPVIGAFQDFSWAEEAWTKISKYATGYYIVQNHPGTRFYKQELELAFGSHLPALKAFKREFDPEGKFHPLE